MNKMILAYNFTPERLAALKLLCMMLRVPLKPVERTQLGSRASEAYAILSLVLTCHILMLLLQLLQQINRIPLRIRRRQHRLQLLLCAAWFRARLNRLRRALYANLWKSSRAFPRRTAKKSWQLSRLPS
mgnify:CR=1 FL=1